MSRSVIEYSLVVYFPGRTRRRREGGSGSLDNIMYTNDNKTPSKSLDAVVDAFGALPGYASNYGF